MRVLDELERWYEAHAPVLEADGLSPGFGRSVGDRTSPAGWVSLESSAWTGELRVWESGDAELRATRRGSGRAEVTEPHDIETGEDLERVLARLTQLVGS
jgi:hypothetical protein